MSNEIAEALTTTTALVFVVAIITTLMSTESRSTNVSFFTLPN